MPHNRCGSCGWWITPRERYCPRCGVAVRVDSPAPLVALVVVSGLLVLSCLFCGGLGMFAGRPSPPVASSPPPAVTVSPAAATAGEPLRRPTTGPVVLPAVSDTVAPASGVSGTQSLPLDEQIRRTQRELEATTAELVRVQTAAVARLSADPRYAEAARRREALSAKARAAAGGNGNLAAASRELLDAIQAVADMRRAVLDVSPENRAAGQRAAAAEAELAALLARRGVVVEAVPPAEREVLSPSAAVRAPQFGSGSPWSGGGVIPRDSAEKTVFVRSYTRRDGTHVQAHYRRPPGGGGDRRR